MSVKVIPVVHYFKEVNNVQVRDGDMVMGSVEPHHDYKNAVVGARFQVDRFDASIFGVWEKANTFSATFKILWQAEGNVFVVDQATNRKYTILPSDFVHIAQNTIIDHGVFSGQFDFVKRQKRIGIRLV